MITIGLDTHPGSHTVAALDAQGATLATLTVKNLPEGFADLRTLCQALSRAPVGRRGRSESVQLPLCRELAGAGGCGALHPPKPDQSISCPVKPQKEQCRGRSKRRPRAAGKSPAPEVLPRKPSA